MPFLVMHSLALLVAPHDDERVQGFWDREAAVWESLRNTDGFIARRRAEDGKVWQGPDEIILDGVDEGEGPFTHPKFFTADDPGSGDFIRVD
jgi:hypothetical protein